MPFYHRTEAGEFVTEDNALQLATVWACVRVLSQSVAQLPWHVFREPSSGQREMVRNISVARVLNSRPNPEMTAIQFRETMMTWGLIYGNAYAEIVRGQNNQVVALWPIHPDFISVKRDSQTGALFYSYAGTNGRGDIDPSDIFHVPGFSITDGVVGVSVISYAAQSMGLTKAAEKFGQRFFGNGAQPDIILQHPKTLSAEASARLIDSLDAKHKGRSHNRLLLQEGMTAEKLTIPPDDAQFLETRKFQSVEICRWFGVPPHLVGDLERATFSNIEEQGINFVRHSLLPWIKKFEQEADAKLFGENRVGYFTKLNVDGLMRGNAESRVSYYRSMIEIGAMSPNEVRKLEDLNARDDADMLTMQVNRTTLERIGEEPEAPEPALPAAPTADPPEIAAQSPISEAAERENLRRMSADARAAEDQARMMAAVADLSEWRRDHAVYQARDARTDRQVASEREDRVADALIDQMRAVEVEHLAAAALNRARVENEGQQMDLFGAQVDIERDRAADERQAAQARLAMEADKTRRDHERADRLAAKDVEAKDVSIAATKALADD